MNLSQFLIFIGLLVTACIFIGINSFAASLKQTTFEVSNLSCGSCLSRIDETLKSYTGYSKLGADLRQGIVVVEHESSLKEQTIAKAISDIGYPAKAVAEKKTSKAPSLFQGQGTGYGCCGGGRSSACSASASTWKRLFNRQPAAPSAE